MYAGGPDFKEYTEFLGKIYTMYMWANPLHADFFPDLRQMEVRCSVCMSITMRCLLRSLPG